MYGVQSSQNRASMNTTQSRLNINVLFLEALCMLYLKVLASIDSLSCEFQALGCI